MEEEGAHQREKVETTTMNKITEAEAQLNDGNQRAKPTTRVGEGDWHDSTSSPPKAERRGEVGGCRGEASEQDDALDYGLNRVKILMTWLGLGMIFYERPVSEMDAPVR